MRRRRRSLRACLLLKAETVVSSWMKRSLAHLLGSTLKSGRRGVIGLLHARGHLSRRVDTLLVMQVAHEAVPHTEAPRVDGGEVTPLLLLGEVVRGNGKVTDSLKPPSLVLSALPHPLLFTRRSRTTPAACIHRTNPSCSHIYDQSISLSSRPLLTPRRASRTTLHSFWHSISPSIVYVFASSSLHIPFICAYLE